MGLCLWSINFQITITNIDLRVEYSSGGVSNRFLFWVYSPHWFHEVINSTSSSLLYIQSIFIKSWLSQDRFLIFSFVQRKKKRDLSQRDDLFIRSDLLLFSKINSDFNCYSSRWAIFIACKMCTIIPYVWKWVNCIVMEK